GNPSDGSPTSKVKQILGENTVHIPRHLVKVCVAMAFSFTTCIQSLFIPLIPAPRSPPSSCPPTRPPASIYLP
ncbi:hypothetical protein PgNI_06076, partial [Pyricularia grisea]|uniref:Uncharacterized protein n=1 Tax=Pyricularia grisea TaxID=148305 RepID=A0A6P8B7N1_PYRGI